MSLKANLKNIPTSKSPTYLINKRGGFLCLEGTCGVLIFLLLFISAIAYADWQNYSDDKIADAIYKAENSKKYPYGIKSIETNGDVAFARKVCLNSIKNAKKRYSRSGSQEDFITFMGRRYSPPEINPNWVRLVKYFLRKEN